MQTIALASTQVFQPIWSRAAAEPSAAASHNSPDLAGDAALPSPATSADAAVVALAQTPQKGYLLRTASPLLEEMLESPVTASKPAPEAASGSPGRHALYQDASVGSNSKHQHGPVLCPLPCAMSSMYGTHATSTRGLPALGSAAGTDRSRQGVLQTLSKDVMKRRSMSGGATDAAGVTAVSRAHTCQDLRLPGPDTRLEEDAAAMSSSNESQGKAEEGVGYNDAIMGIAARCCSETIASAASSLSLGYLPGNAQAVTGAKMAAEPSGGCMKADAKDTTEQNVAQQQAGKYLCRDCVPYISA